MRTKHQIKITVAWMWNDMTLSKVFHERDKAESFYRLLEQNNHNPSWHEDS